jgi:hypothetical protein
MSFRIAMLWTLVLLPVFAAANDESGIVTRVDDIAHYRDSVAVRFVVPPLQAPQWGDSVETIMLTVADLDTMGWRGLLPRELDDTCVIRRTSFVDMNAFATYRITRMNGPGDWDGVPETATVRAFIHDETDRPLFALTYPEYARARKAAPVSYEATCSLLTGQTPVEVLGGACPDSLKPRGGVVTAIAGITHRTPLIFVDLAVFHLVETVIAGEPTCVWLIASYGRKSVEERAHLEEYDTRLEVAHAGQTFRYDDYTLVRWDGFPEHPENVVVMENLEQWLREYRDYRREWEPPGPRPERPRR